MRKCKVCGSTIDEENVKRSLGEYFPVDKYCCARCYTTAMMKKKEREKRLR